MNNIDDLKQKWQEIKPSDNCADDNFDALSTLPPVDLSKPRTIKDRIISRLKRLFIAIATGFILIPSLYHDLHAPALFLIIYCAFFCLAAILNFMLLRSLHKADFATMTTVDAIRFVSSFIKRRKQFKLVLTIYSNALIASLLMITMHHNDPWLIAAIGIGATIGIIIGLAINSRFNRDLRDLHKFFGDE